HISRTPRDALFQILASGIPILAIVDLYKSKRSICLSAFRIQFNRAFCGGQGMRLFIQACGSPTEPSGCQRFSQACVGGCIGGVQSHGTLEISNTLVDIPLIEKIETAEIG